VAYNYATGEPSGSAGNPLLDPWKAWAYDLSYEKYFNDSAAILPAAAFYKDLSTYIYTQTVDYDFQELYDTTRMAFSSPG
jgi:outer membrane receptor protein involved in Fe transport